MKNFYSLKVLEITSLTNDSVCIKLDIKNLTDEVFHFISGQYITIKHIINDEDVRRSYSISSAPNKEGFIEIGVKLIKGGLMSTYLTKNLNVGDSLDVMPPTGNFILETNKSNENHYMAVCAGSGITPVLSMVRDVLNNEPLSSFTILYGNKNRSSIMFAEELLDLERNFQSQLFIYYAFSREDVSHCIKGRINLDNLHELFINNNLSSVNRYFLCGPGEMIDNTNQFLLDRGVEKEYIYFERFVSDNVKNKTITNDFLSNVTVCVDGDDFEFELSSNGESILDAAMNEGADLPFSCKGGVCCVCKAKVIKGKVTMDNNSALSQEEVDQGYILSCQSHPDSEEVFVDFDEI